MTLQNSTKLKKIDKIIFNWCKLEVVFRNKAILGNTFQFKHCVPNDVISGIIHMFHYELYDECYYGLLNVCLTWI